LLKDKAKTAFHNVIDYLNEQYEAYCLKTKQRFEPLAWKTKVITYFELYSEVKKKYGNKLDEKIESITKEMKEAGADTRDICLKIVETVKQLSLDKSPVIVLFFSPPYCPHNTLKTQNKEEMELLGELANIVAGFTTEQKNENFKILRFFPSLSDSSYLKIDDDDASVDTLVNNLPNWDEIYNVPVKQIKNLSIPAVNFGVYGKDAHKWTERVYMPYSFETLPKLVVYAIKSILNK
jgi:arginine utilization protein RocB